MKDTKTSAVSFRGTDTERKILRRFAEDSGTTVGDMVRIALIKVYGEKLSAYTSGVFFTTGGIKKDQIDPQKN